MLHIIHGTYRHCSATLLGLGLLLLPEIASAQIAFEVRSHIKFSSIEDLIVGILNIFIIIAVPITVLFVIMAGFKYVTAQGNASQLEEAKRSLVYAIIGFVMIVGAVALSEIISGVVDSFKA